MSATLYHQALVQRAKTAYGKGRLDNPTTSITLDNPLCGDRVTIDIEKSGDHIGGISHHVRGCILCEAAAATIAEYCRNRDLSSARAILPAIRAMMRDGDAAPADWSCLDIFTPVHSAKSRRDCVLLPFEAFEKAIATAS
ncbi:iron-sulfur cluster assembly scaffold protein [Dongia soli]|uniref:Iron-sulfur cluster assembly scaffold protein n=1 Tax=Dongia soli TaxID=600628 RepID=A0ABU5EAD5_9PROT|nr:iron-sulfur cluster assembly scaffold protein [Dongia soli]MDY0882498.1 iron-sulfur cluster assembly scaffold protein [Dongia soli]